MTPSARLAAASLVLFSTLGARAQLGLSGPGMGSYGGGTFGGSYRGARDRSDGPDLWGGLFDPRDDEDTWDSRFVTDLLWEQALEDRPVTGPVMVDGRILLAFAGRTLRAYGEGDGSVAWTADLPGDATSSLVPHASGDVFLTTLQGDALRVRAKDGTAAFRAHLSQEIRTPPALAGDILVVAARDDLVFGLDVATGAVRWKAATGGSSLTAPTVDPRARLALVADQAGKVHAVRIDSGKISWTYDADGSVLAPVACSESRAFVSGSDRRLVALDLDDGSVDWKRRLGAPGGAAGVVTRDDEAGEILVIATLDNMLQAVRTGNGFRLWTQKLPRRVREAPRVAGNVVWIAPNATAETRGFMARNGYPLGQAALPKAGSDYGVGAPFASEKAVAVASYGRKLALFKRITSLEVENGEEELPEPLEDDEETTASTSIPGFPAFPAGPRGFSR